MEITLFLGAAVLIGVVIYVVWGMGYGRDSDDENTLGTPPEHDQ